MVCVSHSLRLKILLLFKVQQSLEKISKLEQEKEHWMLEAQLARIKLEKENQRMADRLRSTSSAQLRGLAQESAAAAPAPCLEEGAAKVPAEPLQSTSLVSVLLLALACGLSQTQLFQSCRLTKQNSRNSRRLESPRAGVSPGRTSWSLSAAFSVM